MNPHLTTNCQRAYGFTEPQCNGTFAAKTLSSVNVCSLLEKTPSRTEARSSRRRNFCTNAQCVGIYSTRHNLWMSRRTTCRTNSSREGRRTRRGAVIRGSLLRTQAASELLVRGKLTPCGVYRHPVLPPEPHTFRSELSGLPAVLKDRD